MTHLSTWIRAPGLPACVGEKGEGSATYIHAAPGSRDVLKRVANGKWSLNDASIGDTFVMTRQFHRIDETADNVWCVHGKYVLSK